MKFIPVFFMALGLFIITSITISWPTSFLIIFEILFGIFALIFPFLGNKNTVLELSTDGEKVTLRGEEAEEIIDDITENLWNKRFLTSKNRKIKFVSDLIFGLLTGPILLLDAFDIYNFNFGYKDIFFVIVGAWLISYGITKILKR
ncbi:hypothetical protein XO10_04705 [Marinitoga sp. 1135]|uniref:Uncharacterized protein n=1 Tax=Marinitoga piezophila (strain DSM 14283 / JCM 11233 / KA3) TaxID=443254 RepID=H2J7R7_MARPK|nr:MULTISPECIES: hypothetical protein [Marinitoga]AEX85408.1 hypothetical protein Marpi_0996 [Marinitoga piezophila KA3]APT75882.1 hypothetical protein LN42_05450 [Marinitoga sp. 1137]NUU95583.1 hypothetical protein [Marinitoga sp. 1135]NUU97537.1 hypothetical protein [Marinitoga sp. 1138]